MTMVKATLLLRGSDRREHEEAIYLTTHLTLELKMDCSVAAPK